MSAPLFHDLETERLLLRCISHEHRAFILRQFSDAEVSRYLYDNEPYTRIEEADELIGFYTAPEPRMQHRWILVTKDGGQPIGTCGFHCWDEQSGLAELGYDMQPSYWGRGLMTEALREALRFAAEEMRARRVVAHIYPGNARSVAMARRLGFTLSDEPKSYVFRGVEYPHQVYSLALSPD